MSKHIPTDIPEDERLLLMISREHVKLLESIEIASNVKRYFNKLSSEDYSKQYNALVRKYGQKDAAEKHDPTMSLYYNAFISNMAVVSFCTVFEEFVEKLRTLISQSKNESIKKCTGINPKLTDLYQKIGLSEKNEKLKEIYKFRNDLVHENLFSSLDSLSEKNKKLWKLINMDYLNVFRESANIIYQHIMRDLINEENPQERAIKYCNKKS